MWQGNIPFFLGPTATPETGLGTVTSVGLSMPGIFTVSGSPVIAAGTLTTTLVTQTANRIFAGPAAGVPAIPTFRALVAADLPAGTVTSSGTLNYVAMFTPSGSAIGNAPIKIGSLVTRAAPVNTGTNCIAFGGGITMSGTDSYLMGFNLLNGGGNKIFAIGSDLVMAGGLTLLSDIVCIGFLNTFAPASGVGAIGVYSIGDSNTYTDFTSYCTVIGESNDLIRTDHCTVVGIDHNLTDVNLVYVFGESNTVELSTSIVVVGVGNLIDSSTTSTIIGNQNTMSSGADVSVIIGNSCGNGGFINSVLIGVGISSTASDLIELGLNDTTKWVFDQFGSVTFGGFGGTATLSPNATAATAGYIYSFDGTGDTWSSPTTIVGTVGWLQNGNTVTALKYIGTNDTFDFPIYTDGVERARFLAADGNFGIGLTAPTARTHSKGSGATSATFSLKSGNSTGTDYLFVRDDGSVYIFGSSGFASTFDIRQRSFADTHIINIYNNDFSKLCFRATDNGAAGTITIGNSIIDINNYTGAVGIGIGSGTPRLRVGHMGVGGDVLSVTVFGGSGSAQIADNGTGDSVFYLQNAAGTSTQIYITSNGTSLFNGGDVGIAMPVAVTARLQVRGVDATLANFAFKAQDNIATELFNVRNDGSVAVGILAAGNGKLHTFGMLNSINHRLEPVTDVTEDVSGATVNTTDATTTTLQTIAVPADTVFLIEARITARKTAGAGAGTVGDGNGYIRTVKAKNVGGIVTIGTVQTSFTSEDIGVFLATFDVSGTNVRIRITGAASDDVTWNTITRIEKVD